MILRCSDFSLSLDDPLIMGIINVTPDSFSDGGAFLSVSNAIEHGLRLIEEGAHILDVGGESTRPGAMPVDESEELRRVIPVIEGLKDAGVPLSIDTQKTIVMREAITAGASMVNDVNALLVEGAIEAVASTDVAICLMHKQGNPKNMQENPVYGDVVKEVGAFLRERVQAVESAGVARQRIVIDPGFGFGKTVEQNLQLLNRLPELAMEGIPLLVGLSRKSMLGQLTGQDVGERLPASLTVNVIAAQKGAKILRVHDVQATRDALRVLKAVKESHD